GLPAVATLLDVGIGDRTVAVARDSVWQQFVYSPRVWASTVATLAVFLLVSTAFATGTVRPAPPRAPTPMPGEPTPTPDTRPQLSLGGLQLVAPALPVLPTAVPVEVGGVQSQPTAEPVDDAPAPAPPVRSNPAVPRAPPTVPQPRQPPPAPAC